MALSMCLFFVLSSAQNDYTDQPVANTFILIGLQLLAGVLSIFALNNLWTQLATFVGLTFFAVYILSNDRFKPFYLMYLINFILMCYYPVTGKDIYVRLIILEASAVILMMLQFIVHRKGFDKKVRAGIEQAFAAVRADVKNINSDGPDEKFNSAEGMINAAINMITGKYFSIRDLKGYAKEIRTLSLLQVGSKILLELRKTNKDINIGTFLSLLDKIEEFYKEDIVKMMLRGLFQKNLNSMDSRQTGI